jgi:antitoxin component YwqK of YwqJK toxin-antitoxin module
MRCPALFCLVALPVLASNGPEAAQKDAETEVLVKLDLLCGVPFTVRYDGASLKAHNRDIAHDQTGGSNECNEPLRYLWSLCQTEEGKQAVRRAEVSAVVCRGTSAPEGSLTRSGTTLVVERAFEEPSSFLRARQQFEALLRVKLSLSTADPYLDDAWNDFRHAPNPVTSTTTYCLVEGKKVELEQDPTDAFVLQHRDGAIRCLQDGAVVTDLTFEHGLRTGLQVQRRDAWRRQTHYRDGKRQGDEQTLEGGKLLSVTHYEADERVWEQELHPDGSLKRYWRQFPRGQAVVDLDAQQHVQGLRCMPEVAADEVLKGWCGFGKPREVVVYDGTGKVNRTLTLEQGRVTREVPGDSAYAPRSAVTYVDGEKDGEERVTRKDGTLESLTVWKHGKEEGHALTWADDGKKVLEDAVWRAGVLQQRTRFFLNGEPKLVETFPSPEVMTQVEHFDLGGVSAEGHFVRCRRGFGERWCRDGLQRRFFEDGGVAEQETFEKDQRVGLREERDFDGSRTEERYEKGVLTWRRRFGPDGGVTLDEAYEADGSRTRR